MQYNLVRRDGDANITVVIDGNLHVADDQHPNFEKIVEAVLGGESDATVLSLIDASVGAAAKFENLSERVTVANSRVYVDGDEVTGPFADQIVRFLEDDLEDRKSTRLNSSHVEISYAVFCLKKKNKGCI